MSSFQRRDVDIGTLGIVVGVAANTAAELVLC
jgi:hypothetical protein